MACNHGYVLGRGVSFELFPGLSLLLHFDPTRSSSRFGVIDTTTPTLLLHQVDHIMDSGEPSISPVTSAS